jgi:hypothetical protein
MIIAFHDSSICVVGVKTKIFMTCIIDDAICLRKWQY